MSAAYFELLRAEERRIATAKAAFAELLTSASTVPIEAVHGALEQCDDDSRMFTAGELRALLAAELESRLDAETAQLEERVCGGVRIVG